MKKLILSIAFVCLYTNVSNAQNIGGMLKNKAKQTAMQGADNPSKKAESGTTKLGSGKSSKDTKAMEGTWKVDGVIVTTENEALKGQIGQQEQQYNDAYKGSIWVFKKDGTIAITLPKSASSPGGTGSGRYELAGEKIIMEINGQPNEYDLKFEDGQMLLINISPLNTVYYVFIKN